MSELDTEDQNQIDDLFAEFGLGEEAPNVEEVEDTSSEVEDTEEFEDTEEVEDTSSEVEDTEEVEEAPKLTPRVQAPPQDTELERQLKEVRAQLVALQEAPTQGNQPAETPHATKADFEQLRTEMFTKGLEEEVKGLGTGVTLNQMVNSQQFDEFLAKPVFGARTGKDLLREAYRGRDTETTMALISIFSEQYLKPALNKSVGKLKKPSPTGFKEAANDEVVPSSSKVEKPSAKGKKKYLYKDTDLHDKTDLFRRGKLTHEDFSAFVDKFEKAEDAGRIQMT